MSTSSLYPPTDPSSLPEGPSSAPAKSVWRRLWFWLVLFMAMLLVGFLAWRSHQGTLNKMAALHVAHPVQVVVSTAYTDEVPVYLSALGTVTPTYNVTVRTQINGRLLQVFFKEGQMVKAGEPLAEIDSRAYQAQLAQFEGQLLRDQALFANAQRDLKRYKLLYPQGGVSQQTYETQDSLVKQLEGTVKSDQGQVEAVKVNLAYCQIKAPLDGRIGLRLVDPGNLVQTADANGLVVINTIQPISVIFSIPEDNVPQVMQAITTAKPLLVKALDRGQNKLLATGELVTIDNQIDATTGTVKLKAQFENKDYHLFPNQFVNVQLLIYTLHAAILVPTAAIQHGIKGTFVYVVGNNATVSSKPVVVTATTGDNSVISSGVILGQQVVVEGADKLTDGAKVVVAKAVGHAA